MKHRWALFAMGVWVAGSVMVSIVATQNFHTIDRLLADSPSGPFRDAVSRLGESEARDLLRYLSSELNRLYFQLWSGAQVIVGALVIWLLTGHAAMRRPRLVVLAMLGVVLLMIGYLTPQIVTLGRSLDFVAREPPPPQLARFWMLHGAYTSLELAKLAAGLAAAFWISRGTAENPVRARESA